jgi:DNA helicase-2/ATP-dependent DNA helicase PcrA
MMENAAPEEITVSFATTSPVPQNMAVQTRAKEELSFTQLQTFERCPYQYWFAHVLRMPIASKWTMNFGKSIHAALQQWYELLKEGQSVKQISLFDAAPQSAPAVPPVTTLTDILRRAWISEGYPTKKFEDEKKADAEKMLREYYRQHENAWTMPAYIEQRFRLVIGGEVMKGSIDRLDVLPDGTIEIIDYKTGTPKTSEDLKFQDKEQLLVYHLAAQRGLQLTPTLLSYYYVQNNTKASFEPKEKDLKKIEDSVGETAAAIKISNFKATPSPHVCGNCDFKDICPYREL